MYFLFILFFIHLGRMGLDRSTFGILSPVVAVIGDMFIALVVAFAIIAPIRWIFRKFSGLFLNRLYHWVKKVPEDQWKRLNRYSQTSQILPKRQS